MITKVSTLNMSKAEWRKDRMNSIGGSDAGTLLGLNSYSSPYALWAEKTGAMEPEDISDKESVRLGNDLEDYVAHRWMEATGKKVRRDNHIIRNDKFPFAHANIDRAVIGENAGLECKTTSNWEYQKLFEEGKFPDVWYAQMMHYMMVCEADRWYLGVVSFGKGFYEFTIERDDAEIEALMASEERFWHHVTNRIPPAVDGSEGTTEAIKSIFGDSVPGVSIDLSAMEGHIRNYDLISKQIKMLEEDKRYHQNAIMEFMGAAEKGRCSIASVSYKSSVRQNFDKKRYEAEAGRIPDDYYNPTISRTFRLTMKKEAN